MQKLVQECLVLVLLHKGKEGCLVLFALSRGFPRVGQFIEKKHMLCALLVQECILLALKEPPELPGHAQVGVLPGMKLDLVPFDEGPVGSYP